MSETASIDYGNWIRQRVVFTLAGLACAALLFGCVIYQLNVLWGSLALTVGILLGALTGFLGYLYWQFSKGGYQHIMWRQTLAHCQPNPGNRVLDIGTGNGAIAIQLAAQFSDASVDAVDLWDSDWEYSQASCEENAKKAGVSQRVNFQQSSAAKLPYPNDTFDWVVSHFVFHEVKDVIDKKLLINEALRVLKPGGHFVFHDMFFNAAFYGHEETLSDYLSALPIRSWRLNKTLETVHAPIIMHHRKVFGCCGVLTGEK